MKRPHFEVYKSKNGWRWRLKAGNGRVLCSGESHPQKAGAMRAIRTVRDAALRALPLSAPRLRPVTESSSFVSPPGTVFDRLN